MIETDSGRGKESTKASSESDKVKQDSNLGAHLFIFWENATFCVIFKYLLTIQTRSSVTAHPTFFKCIVIKLK